MTKNVKKDNKDHNNKKMVIKDSSLQMLTKMEIHQFKKKTKVTKKIKIISLITNKMRNKSNKKKLNSRKEMRKMKTLTLEKQKWISLRKEPEKY